MKTIQYIPQQIDTADVKLPKELELLVEFMAKNVHEVWAAAQIKEGWTYGRERDDANKKHPNLIPYSALPDSEKGYDRLMALDTIKLVKKLGSEIIKRK